MLGKLRRNEQGFTFIEVLIAMLILITFSVGFLSALQTSSKAVMLADVRVTAESLAKSQMESIKHETYRYAPDNGVQEYVRIDIEIPAAYSVKSEGRGGAEIDGVVGTPWSNETGQAVSIDSGLQRVSLIVYHLDPFTDTWEAIWRLEGFKALR